MVSNVQGDIDAYAPLRTGAQDRYTLNVYAPSAGAVAVTERPLLLRATALRRGVRFLVRGPSGTAMSLTTQQGNISVADYDGVVNAHTDRGDVKMLIPLYGSASIGTGNMSVIFAATKWNGTLHFSTVNGNVELYANEHVQARVHLHTGNGTVFDDFNLRGTSSGTSETIDGAINGGASQWIDVTVKTGSIRLMQLKPQV